MAFGEYRLDDVQIGQQGLIIGPRKEPWQNILSASVHPLATRRPLGWAIVRLVLAIPFSLYGVAYAVYATLEPAHSFPEWSVLVTGAIFALIGVLLGVAYLFVDFHYIDVFEERKAPVEAEWFGALLLMASLVMVYLNVLRILASRRR